MSFCKNYDNFKVYEVTDKIANSIKHLNADVEVNTSKENIAMV